MTPSISIITTAYNSQATIADAIISVLNQTYAPIEYFIMDGGSTDSTIAIAESYRSAFEQKGVRYTVASEKDNGVYDAMNKGISRASGEVIGMINSDDWYEPHAVYTAVSTFATTDCDMMFGNLRIHTKGKCIIKRVKNKPWVTSRNWNHPTTFTRRTIHMEHPFPCQSLYDDFDLYVKLRKTECRIVTVDDILANFRTGGMSNHRSMAFAFERFWVRYRIYRKNKYSVFYFLECLFVEFGKYVLS